MCMMIFYNTNYLPRLHNHGRTKHKFTGHLTKTKQDHYDVFVRILTLRKNP